MKFLTAFLVLLIALNSYPQANLDLTLTFITDEPQYKTTIINFGLDSMATNGIDPQLGEGTYPPDGCGGPGNVITCVAFLFYPPLFNEDIGPRDYRFGILPYTGQVEHRILIALGIYASQAEMFWNFPAGVNVHLEDELGGIFFELDLQGAGSFVITESMLILTRFIMVVTYNNVVPIELTSFTASILQNEKAVQLNWSTATEINNSGFEIKRASISATPGQGLEKIGFVPGFGTTTEPKSYSFIDEDVTTGTYKYRLKQIDFDGSFEFSNEIEVEVDFTPKEFVLYQNYPNPFNPNTVISYQLPVTSNVTVKVYDVLGNEVATLVNEEKQPGVYEVVFDASSLASGIYLYKLLAGSFVQTKKMILLK